LRYLGGAFVTAATLLTMMYFAPPTQASLSVDRLQDPRRIVSILMRAKERFTPPDPPTTGGGDEGGGTEPAPGDAGEAGTPEAPETGKRLGIRGRDARNAPKRMQAQDVREVAVLTTLGTLASTIPVSSIYGADHYQGRDPISALGALMGPEIGTSGGFWGLAPAGTGRGGGGDGDGTIGYGGTCTAIHCPGRGNRTGPGTEYGTVGPDMGGRRTGRVPGRLRAEPASVVGSLSKEAIRRVVRRHHNEIKHCYERELQSQPDLEGRVSVHFVIARNGSVMAAGVQAATLNNTRAQDCVARAVHRMSFPQPENGGVVSVTYPFIFQSQ
jgi:hypothetical protein